ncbi:MAG: hypothetical protein AUG51_20010 [Acidobacteria bacterium 13_1_20CM_3_53_8]|nr:MAG: hypothetical protein AUG51_20010 [Acidobacteria bacterium 13_1_20CM_3_53_8]
MVVAVIFLCAAGVCLLVGATDAAFVTATLGVLAWFLNLRSRLKKSIRTDDDHLTEDDVSGETDEN